MADAPPEQRPTTNAIDGLKRFLQVFTGPWTKRNLISWVILITSVLFVKGCIIDQYTIPTGSMEPTLRGDPRFFRGDRVLVNKWLYGPRIPFTTYRLSKWSAPERWDIVVFRAVDPEAAHPILIKRVVGLPGEHVQIRDGNIEVAGQVVTPPPPLDNILHYTDEFSLDVTERKRQFLALAQQNEPLPNLDRYRLEVHTLYNEMNRLHPAVQDKDIASLSVAEIEALCADVHPVALRTIDDLFAYVRPEMLYGVRDEPEYAVVPEDHYFMLGDNSAHSLDGRMYGWVPHHHLYGRTFAVWWPWPRRQDFTGFSYTWWGRGLLYGIPLVLILLEICLFMRDILRKKAKV